MRRPSRMLIAALSVAATLTCSSSASAIVGGSPVPEGGFPYVANVTIADAFGCTGTLIAPQWVLSAGHCGSITGAGVATPVGWPAGAVQLPPHARLRRQPAQARHAVRDHPDADRRAVGALDLGAGRPDDDRRLRHDLRGRGRPAGHEPGAGADRQRRELRE